MFVCIVFIEASFVIILYYCFVLLGRGEGGGVGGLVICHVCSVSVLGGKM